jgi:hypothetical protein
MKKLTELLHEEFKPFTKKGEEDKKGLEEGDFGEVDNGMYAGNTVSGAFSAKNTPEKAPVMETNVNEISTGLAQRAQSAAFATAEKRPEISDPIGRAKAYSQAQSFSDYVNPELRQFLETKRIKVVANQNGNGVILTVPSAVGTDYTQIEVARRYYEFVYGNENQLGGDMLRILPNIIKRIQADINTKAPVPAANELEEGSMVKKKIRYKMTEDQKKMFDELRMIQESIKKLDGNRKLLY